MEDTYDVDVFKAFKDAYPDEYLERYLEWEELSRHPTMRKFAKALIPTDGPPRPDLGPLPEGTAFEVTLTVPPDDSTVIMIKTLADGFYKILGSKMWDIVYYEACVELTKAGIPHIHAIVVCGGRPLKAANAKKLYPHRMSVTRAKDLVALRDYVWKGWGNISEKNFCDDHNIRQFFRTGRSIYGVPEGLW